MEEDSDRAGARRTVILLVVAALFIAAGVLLLAKQEPPRPQSTTVAATAAHDAAAVANSASAAPTTSARPPSDGAPLRAKRFTAEDRRKRDQMRELIYRAFNRPPPPPPERGSRGVEGPLGPNAPALDKDYIRERIRGDFVPMAKECYEAALEREAGLGGKLVFSFTIVGDESVGGIVESVDFAEGSDIEDEDMLLCMRESMLSMTFAPPEKGGTVTVTYPFRFSPDGPADAGG